ncbi:MAG: rRNA pseudouridine2604 synthase [Candidatus Parcubacteria bacterium]|jgi:23S rRNA pseudouridine2604 synthase|nr:rRNA pseudouridine2604 synthase [Candidatus Parcubacteria bacterium]
MSDFPMRINKYLALQGHATRRGADELISRGRVFINGKQAELGDKVIEQDTVEVKAGKRAQKERYLYFAYNKPRGVITHSPGEDEQDVRDTLPELADSGVFPVGRLDKDSHGLIILTNDGRITDRLLHPRHEHDKEYVVKTKQPLRKSFKAHMEGGVDIEGYMTKPAKVGIVNEHTFSITLTEGKKHQIRRMVVALFNEVADLKRVRVLNVKLGTLKSGQARAIEGTELDEFLTLLGLKSSA